MIKFANIGDYKVAQNFGYLTTDVELKNGNIVTYDLATKEVALPTTSTAKTAGLAIVFNAIVESEVDNADDFVVKAGGYPRIFTLASLAGHLIDINDLTVATAYGSLSVGDKLVANAVGKLEKATDVSGYAEYFEIVEKTSFGGNGLRLVVRA